MSDEFEYDRRLDDAAVFFENMLEGLTPNQEEKPMAAGDPRHNINIRRNQLLSEVARHRAKLSAAERHLERLKGIPDRDPFENGQVIRFRRGGMRFVALRAGGFWYTTGMKVSQPQRATWVEFIDWLVAGSVAEIEVMVGTGPAPLSDLGTPASPPLPVEVDPTMITDPPEHARLPFNECTADHKLSNLPHAWQLGPKPEGPWFWCRGLRKLACSYTDVEDHAPHQWTYQGDEVWCKGL